MIFSILQAPFLKWGCLETRSHVSNIKTFAAWFSNGLHEGYEDKKPVNEE
jgi:hypothetical protein